VPREGACPWATMGKLCFEVGNDDRQGGQRRGRARRIRNGISTRMRPRAESRRRNRRGRANLARASALDRHTTVKMDDEDRPVGSPARSVGATGCENLDVVEKLRRSRTSDATFARPYRSTSAKWPSWAITTPCWASLGSDEVSLGDMPCTDARPLGMGGLRRGQRPIYILQRDYPVSIWGH
jgi:hypothetical protein